MSCFQLASGEEARVEIIPRSQAISILSKPAPRRTWFGQKYRSAHRTSRGPGPAADLLNFGLIVNDKCRAVMRFGMAPWGNRPAIAAVGASLANQTAYLSRLWASGISSEDLVTFIQKVNLQFPREMQRRRPDRLPYRYVLSLDSMSGWLIDQPKYDIFEESPPVAGRIYYQAGALHAGPTENRSRPSRYIDPVTKQIRSLYQDGRSMARELNLQEVALIDDGPKHRFVFILAPRGSAEYMSYRKALPAHCREWAWGENSVGWIQPRLLARQLRAWLNSLKNGPTAPQFEPGSF